MQRGEEAIEDDEPGVRVRRARDLRKQLRHKIGELSARERAAQGPVLPRQPAPHRRGGLARRPKAHGSKLVERFAVVGIGGKNERLVLGFGRRGVLEQRRIMPLHVAQVGEQSSGEGVAAGEAEKTRKAFEPRAIARQRVGLLVGDHLQPVLDRAQKPVSSCELVARRRVDPVAGGQRVERRQCFAQPQLRVSPASDELLGLHKKFDLADAAAADLDIVSFDRDLAMAAEGMDLLLHGVDVGHRSEVEIFAPDERRERLAQRVTGGNVAGAGARLDQRRPFPVPANAFVVVERSRGRDRDLRRGRIRPQPQIGAENIAVHGALLQEFHQRAREPHEERRRLDARHQRCRGGVVEHDDIDVAGIIELVRAHLAHGEHHIAAARFRPRCIGRHKATLPCSCAEEMADRRPDRRVSKIGESCGNAHHRPDAADVGERDQERRLRLHAAQEPHHLALVGGGGDRARRVGQDRREAHVWIGFEQHQKPAGIGARKLPEIGRAVRDAREQRIHRGIIG